MGTLDRKAHSKCWLPLGCPFSRFIGERQASGTSHKMKGWKEMELRDLFLEGKGKSGSLSHKDGGHSINHSFSTAAGREQ